MDGDTFLNIATKLVWDYYKERRKAHSFRCEMDSLNRFRHEPNAIVNSFIGMIDSKSLNEID